MSNHQLGGLHDARGFRGHGDRPNSRGPNPPNRNNGSFNRSAPPNRMNPWEGGVAPGSGNCNMGNHNMGNHNHNMGTHSMGNLNLSGPNMGNHNMGNANIGCNRSSGGLLPTPNMPTAGLLQQPSIQDVQLAVASNVLNLLLPNIQASQQQNRMPSLLTLNTNRGLLPLSPPPISPFQNQNFGGPGLRGPLSSRPDNLGPNRARPHVQTRRSEPYNKMGNQNQRTGQKNANNLPRNSARGSNASSKNVTGLARNITGEKGDGRRNQKTDYTSTSNEREDNVTEDKSKKEIEKRNEIEKTKAAFMDIPSDMFICHVCSKNMWDSLSFINHIKGKAHQTMMERREETYKITTEMKRHEMKVEEQQRQISYGKKQRQGKSIATQPQEYCTMCNLHFNGHLTAHRKSNRHQQLKLFLHPKCEVCQKEFATRLDWDQHLLTAGHLKIAASKREKTGGNHLKRKIENQENNQEKKKEQEGKISQEPADLKTETDTVQSKDKVEMSEAKTEVVMKKPSIECGGSSPKAVAQIEFKRDATLSSSLVLNHEKVAEYDSQKEVGMEMLQEKTGFLCCCCNRFLSSSADAKTHCRSQFHFDKYIAFLRTKETPSIRATKCNENDSSSCKKDEQKEEEKQEVTEPEPVPVPVPVPESEEDEEAEKDEEDEGNWKRRKLEETVPDVTETSNTEEKIMKQDENLGESPHLKDVNKLTTVSSLDDTVNLLILQEEEQDSCEDLERTLLLEETQHPSTPHRGRGGSTRSRGCKRK